MKSIFPPPVTDTSPEELYLDLSFPDPPRDRPYVYLNMVSTVDGKASVSGGANKIGSDADRTVMRNLRSLSDAVMIGSGTLLAEKISLGVPQHLAETRSSLGKSSQPLAIIMSSNKDLPLTNLIKPEPHNTCVLGTEVAESRNSMDYIDIEEVFRNLKLGYSIHYLLVEGGPSLNNSLISSGLVDEIFLTISPKVVGGSSGASTIVNGTVLSVESKLELYSANVLGSELFLRYKVIHTR